MVDRNMLRRSPPAVGWYIGAGVLLVGVIVLICLAAPNAGASGFIRRHGCSEVPLGKSSGTEQPYGPVASCRVLDRSSHWFGDVPATAVLLLDTEKGLVALQVDYRNINAGRQWRAVAQELSASQARHWLTADDTTKLSHDITSRGGVRTAAWTLVYGDG